MLKMTALFNRSMSMKGSLIFSYYYPVCTVKLLIKATFSGSLACPLFTGLTAYANLIVLTFQYIHVVPLCI